MCNKDVKTSSYHLLCWCCANNRVYKLVKDWLDDKEIEVECQ